MTAFLVVLDQNEAVTLVSVEPRAAFAAVAQRPGTRHPLDQGAPGRAVRRLVTRVPGGQFYETSHGEVIQGLSSVAVPLEVPGQPPAALAVVYLTGADVEVEAIAGRLAQAAHRTR
jgi:DNA-binding IclR family transcriptional regulator